MFYEMKIAGLTRQLPLCKVTDDLYIGAFIMFSDVEITKACAAELLKKAPEFDILITAESKGIPLAYEMSRQSGKKYILARKSIKLYMHDPVSVSVKSITTAQVQTLYLDSTDMEQIRGKRILIVDDVVSTGESMHALECLVEKSGGVIAGKCAVLAEGDARERTDVTFLGELPLFFK